jgi:hypothetical protein
MCSTFKNNAILIFAMIFILNERDQKKINKKIASILKKKNPANNDFTFLIVNFPFISSNIPAAPENAFYIAELIRYSRAWTIIAHGPNARGLIWVEG